MATTTTTTTGTMEYTVVYYKRAAASKVHRRQGASTLDGILAVDPVRHRVTLRADRGDHDDDNNDNNNSSDDDVHDAKRHTKRRPWKVAKPTLVYSGVQREIASGDLQEDDVVLLGGWEVEIGRVRTGRSGRSVASQGGALSNAVSRNRPRATRLATSSKPPLRSRLSRQPLHPRTMTIGKTNGVGSTHRAALVRKQPAHASSRLTVAATTTKGVGARLPQKRLHATVSSSLSPRGATGTSTTNIVRPTQSKTTVKPPTVSLSSSLLSTTMPLPHIPLPTSIRTVLRPHQIEGVDFLYKRLAPPLSTSSSSSSSPLRGCVLGDEMGLGKTLMTIACIAALHRQQRDKQFVVVCPSSLVKNWADEFDKWLGRASQPKRVVIHKGGDEGVRQIRAYTSSMKQQLKNHAGLVLIVSYDLFRRNSSEFSFSGRLLGLLVVDEGHKLKNTNGSLTLAALEALPTEARLCITATPIQNNLGEFYSLANFCCPGVLGDDLASFRKTYERPIAAANQKNASHEQLNAGWAQSKALEAVSKTFLLRRLQSEVLTSMLPPRTEALLFCRPSSQQCDLYRSLTHGVSVGNKMATEALTTLTILRQICAHPFLYDHTKVPAANNDNTNTNNNNTSVTLSGKLLVLKALLQQIRRDAPDDKVVIVSNFTSALSLIESTLLQPHDWTYQRLDGATDTKHRQTLVDGFNRASADTNFCFLLSSKAGGCGLNLVGANRLVMFDPDWNPSSDIQAMGRVYRQGQTKPCTIYRLFSAGTVEEVIYQRQAQKGGLATLTVDAGTDTSNARKTGKGAKFTKEELADCFTLKENCACDTKTKIGKRWPTYDCGPDSLRALGVVDKPLLHVAEHMSETLRYVHIVDRMDERSTIDKRTGKENPMDDSDDESSCATDTSDSENEFLD